MSQQFDVILLAAGSGKRCSQDKPKQYLNIHNQTILAHSLKKLLSLPQLSRLILVLAKDDVYFSDLNIDDDRIKIVEGGSERGHSVLNALLYLNQTEEAADWVLVHDAARCCVRVDAIKKLIATCYEKQCGGLLVNPVKDTIKKVQNNQVEKTIPRQNLFAAQTPQFFLREPLMLAYQDAFAKNILPTDEANAIELQGADCIVVEGDPDNIKVTTPTDLWLAEKILQGKLK